MMFWYGLHGYQTIPLTELTEALLLLAMVMASVDQSYFGAPKFANSVNKQTISSC